MYKATLSGSIRTRLLGKRCALIISLDEPHRYQGEKFFAILKKTTSSFSHTSVVLIDSLQRHQTKNMLPADYQVLGNDWILNNAAFLQECQIAPNQFFRWSKWINHAEYLPALKQIENFYLRSSIFRTFVQQSINERLNKAMILEQCAVLILWKKENFDYIAYPHELNQAMNCILEKIQTFPNTLIPLIYQVD